MKARPLHRAACLFAVVVMLMAAPSARPQETGPPVALAADVIRVEGGDRLVAEGAVEVLSDGRRLTAERLTYDQTTGRLEIEGPLTLQEGDEILLLADSAEVDTDLRNGLLRGARLILDQRLQIAGAELSRREGRFSELRRVVASSCEICTPGTPPLWEIRAGRVIHDEAAQQVYFYDAQFRVAGLPIAYLPTMRVPDPTLTRATGFLTPSVRTTDQVGAGLKLPYFITLGDHADLTLTPYAALDFTRTLEGRYRQAFATGDVSAEGAVSRDSILPGETRAYLFADGRFDLPRDVELRFDLETTTDRSYLQDYDYSSKDRLDSAIGIQRLQTDRRVTADIIQFRSLREAEDNSLIPTLVGDLRYDRRYTPDLVGGWLDLSLIGSGFLRTSEEDIEGRDMATIRGTGHWQRAWTLPAGLRAETEGQLNADIKRISDDSRFQQVRAGVTPVTAAKLGWPLMRPGAGGVLYMLEPAIQVVWSDDNSPDSPNDDSTLTAFDSGNIFGLNRFPGLDRTEDGLRTNLALSWERRDPAAWNLGVTLGKIYRDRDLDQFPDGTGLAGTQSDWLTQIDLDLDDRLVLRSLFLLDNALDPTLNETRIAWESPRLDLAASYVWQRADAALDLTDDLSEVAVDLRYDISSRWSTRADLRRDFIAERTNRAALELSYANECVRVDLSVLRRFRNTRDIDATTSYGLAVTLAGFGDADMARQRRKCIAAG